MKKFLVGGALAAALLSASAFAADMPVKAPPVAAAPMFNWTGGYIGLQGGAAWFRTSWTGTSIISVSDTFRDTGWLAGGTIGYNWQQRGSPWVFGLEADGAWTGIHAKSSPAFCTPLCHSEVDWLATARARIGPAYGAWLPYLTGGAAFGGIHTHTAALLGFDRHDTKTGWTVGGGVEGMFGDRWTVKLEYLYVDFGRQFLTLDTSVGPPPLNLQADYARLHILRVGVNKLF